MKKENKALAKKRKAAQRRRADIARKIKTILWIVIPCLIVAAVIGLIVYGEVRNNLDYSVSLTDDGFIKNIDVNDYVKLADYSDLHVQKSELVTDAMVDEEIDAYLTEQAVLSTTSPAAIKEGDEISIDFTGRVDGEEFGNGAAQDFDLVIGSGTLIEGFEEQLIGHRVGDEFTIKVTFPEDYSQDKDLRGEEAEFDITVNGIYEKPALTDAFVKENLAEYAQTAEEYRAYVEQQVYDQNLAVFVQDTILENSEITIPKKYLRQLKNIYRIVFETEYNYYNQMYSSYAGYYMWENVYDYYGMTKEEYEDNLQQTVEDSARYYLAMQAVYEKEGLSITEEDVTQQILDAGYSAEEMDAAIEDYGTGYWRQNALAQKAQLYLADLVEVE